MLNICFISNPDMNRGSYRVHIYNINLELNKIKNVSSKIITNINLVNNFEIIIIDKCLINTNIINKILEITKTKKIIGCITPTLENNPIYKKLDFCIVGSVEEKDSILKYFKKIFIIPQIETIYNIEESRLKKHKNKDTIVVGYHGNPNHLNHLSISCKLALEKYNEYLKKKNKKLIFLVIAPDNKQWIKGIPNITIQFRKWDLRNIVNDLLEIDIGIVPNISEYYSSNLKENTILGKYKSDTIIRFKNKSNAGRCIVFHQLKIPVIADFTPSNLYILGNPNNGYGVCSEEGWLNGFIELTNCKKRQFISDNAYIESKNKYNLSKWVENFINDLNDSFKN